MRAAVILMSVVHSAAGWLVSLSYIALVVLAVVGSVVISFSGGLGVDAADSRVLKCSTPNDSRTFTPVCP